MFTHRGRQSAFLPVVAAICLGFLRCAWSQETTTSFFVQRLSTPARPIGLDVTGAGSILAVANSEDDSVSLFGLSFSGPDGASDHLQIELQHTVRPIPSPYGVSGCSFNDESGRHDRVLVTSPATNTVVIIDAQSGEILFTVATGAEPRSVVCYVTFSTPLAWVSNYGDSTLSLVNVITGEIIRTVPGVPSSKGWKNLDVVFGYAVVAGYEGNVVTVASPTDQPIQATIPLQRPTSVISELRNSIPTTLFCWRTYIASESENSIGKYCPNEDQEPRTTWSAPTPQDLVVFANRGFPYFGSTTQEGALVIREETTGRVFLVPEVTGAAAVTVLPQVIYPHPELPPVVLVTSPDTNSIYAVEVIVTSPPVSIPNEFAIVNGAGFAPEPRLAPGSLASAFSNGRFRTLEPGPSAATYVPLPVWLSGVSVRVGGSTFFDSERQQWFYSWSGSVEAPLLYVDSNQINFQIPPGFTADGPIPVQVYMADGNTLFSAIQVAPTAPGIFGQEGTGGEGAPAAALNQDNSLNTITNPAPRGSVIQIFATGAGETDPPMLPGEAAPADGNPLVLTRVQPTVTIGGQPARVLFSGMAPGFVGLWQINAEVPADITPGPAVPLTITAEGSISNTVTVAVE